MWKRLFNYLIMTMAAAVYAAGVSLFMDPNSLAPGGVTGISVILNRITGLDTGTLILILNIPILAVGIRKFGLKFILSTIYCIAMTSLFTNLLAGAGAVTNDPFLAALAGGALMALGMGLVFKAGGTTGGTDIIIKLLRIRFKHLRTGSLLLILDALIVGASAVFFRDIERALYAGMAILITSQMLDFVLYGKDGAKLLFLVSDTPEKIADRLMSELEAGVTYVKGMGAYSGKEKNVILCVVRKPLSVKVEEIVKEEDPAAFMIVSNATEIYGEGYKDIFSEKL